MCEAIGVSHQVDVLDKCLNSPESANESLSRSDLVPQEVKEIKTLVSLAEQIRSLPRLTPDTQKAEAGKQRMLQALAAKTKELNDKI